MSNTNESFTRSVALEKALKLYENASPPHPDTIVEAAEKFRFFLEGKAQVPEAEVKPRRAKFVELPVFRLPRFSDEYLYFQFNDSLILYRTDLNWGADAPGGVERINARIESEWRTVNNPDLNTRTKLRDASQYHDITSTRAANLLHANVKGVDFR